MSRTMRHATNNKRPGVVGALALCFALAACRSEEHSQADNRVLCDPKNGTAFMVIPSGTHGAFVRPLANGDHICKQASEVTR